jgi:ketosteroid isomerase-like protein
LAEAFNRRDVDGYLALTTADVRYEDRRKGLRDALEGAQHARKAVQAMFEVVPNSVQMTAEPIAIRGSHLSLSRDCFRDTDYADQPITVAALQIAEVSHGGLIRDSVSFDPDDVNGAFAELTDRWIASGEVEHPEIIKSAHRLTEATNRHDWEALAALGAGAAYVNHRQLSKPGVETIADHMQSFRTMASLVPDFWVEQADVLTQSAMGVVTHVVMRGTSTDGVTIEIPLVALMFFDGDRVTRVETFDADQREQALARFDELNRSR